MKFIHTADWQLGMTRRFLQGEAQARFSDARLEAIRTIGRLAVDEGCTFVVVSGDVFESNQIDRKILARALDYMGATPRVVYYLLPGNHDPLDAASIYRSHRFRDNQPENVVVLDGAKPLEVADGVELVAAPWTSKRPISDLTDGACERLAPSGALRILVAHGALDSRSPDRDSPALISRARLEQRIADDQIHYVALGDRHSRTEEGSSGRVWYSGAPEPTRYDEQDPGHVLVVDLVPGHIDVTARRIGTWTFVEKTHEVTSEADIDALQEWFSALEHKGRCIAKLVLRGQISLAQKTRLDELWEANALLLAALETSERRSELVVVPDDADYEALGLVGFAREALSDLLQRSQSSDEADAVAAEDALALLYGLSKSESRS